MSSIEEIGRNWKGILTLGARGTFVILSNQRRGCVMIRVTVVVMVGFGRGLGIVLAVIVRNCTISVGRSETHFTSWNVLSLRLRRHGPSFCNAGLSASGCCPGTSLL